MTKVSGSFDILDATQATESMGSIDVSGITVPAHVLVDSDGDLIDPATSGNQATANAALANIETATQLLDNVVGTHDSAVPGGLAMLGATYDSSPSDVASGDAVKLRATARGAALTGSDYLTTYNHTGVTDQWINANGGSAGPASP